MHKMETCLESVAQSRSKRPKGKRPPVVLWVAKTGAKKPLPRSHRALPFGFRATDDDLPALEAFPDVPERLAEMDQMADRQAGNAWFPSGRKPLR